MHYLCVLLTHYFSDEFNTHDGAQAPKKGPFRVRFRADDLRRQ